MNESLGWFQVLVAVTTTKPNALPCVPLSLAQWMPAAEFVIETPSPLDVPTIDPDKRCPDPPVCLHGRPAVARTVHRRDSVNIGRTFFTCAWPEGRRCGFFRWRDELDQFSVTTFRPLLAAHDVRRQTETVDPELQLQAWHGLSQGTDAWHQLRACRLTASNFGTVNRNNKFASPADMLRSLLWPTSYDSVAMRYGSVNEKVALRSSQHHHRRR